MFTDMETLLIVFFSLFLFLCGLAIGYLVRGQSAEVWKDTGKLVEAVGLRGKLRGGAIVRKNAGELRKMRDSEQKMSAEWDRLGL